MRIYFRGLKYKNLRALVQRLGVVLPVEEQEQPTFLSKFGFRDDSVVEADETLEEVSGSQNLLVKDNDVDEKIGIEEPRDFGNDDVEDVSLNDPRQVVARNRLIKVFRTTLVKVKKERKTNKFVKLLHDYFAMFEKLFG